MTGVDLVTALLGTPALFALLVLVSGRLRMPAPLLRGVALSGSILAALVAAEVARRFDPTATGFQFVRFLPWIEELGANYYVGIDGINLGPVVVTAFLVPVLFVAMWGGNTRALHAELACILGIETAVLGALVSLNAVPFLVSLELATLGLTSLVGFWGGAGRVAAAKRFYAASAVGSLCVLGALLPIAALHLEQTGSLSFDFIAPPLEGGSGLLQTSLPTGGHWWANPSLLLGLFTVGLALRTPWFPLHGWIRSFGSEASTAGAVLLASSGMTLGAYALLRFALPLLPVATHELGYPLAALAALGVGHFSLLAFAQRDLRCVVLCLCGAQMMLVMVGGFVANVQSWNGSVLSLASHGLISSLLLLLVGMLEQRRGTRSIAAFGGIARPMPVFAFFFGVALLAISGLPLLAGFVGNILILLGSFLGFPGVAVLAAVAVTGLGAVAVVTLRRVLLGPVDNEANLPLIDLGWRERAVLAALVVPIVWIGIWPSPWLRRIEPAVIEWVQHVEQGQQQAVLRDVSAGHRSY